MSPNPFAYTEDAIRSFISDAVETLKYPLCPNVFAQTIRELNLWMDSLRELEAAKEEIEKDWAVAQ